jgi:hypothetical protein
MELGIVAVAVAGLLVALGWGGSQADREAARSEAWQRYEVAERRI